MLHTLKKLFGVEEETRPRPAPPVHTDQTEVHPARLDQLITTSVIGRTLVVTILERELSGPSVFELSHAIKMRYQRETVLRNIVLDMENVQFLDSSGLSSLVDLMGVVKPRIGKIAIAAATQQVEVLFKLTRLELVFMVRRTSIEAINAVESA